MPSDPAATIVLTAIGAILVLTVLNDFVHTTLRLRGAGPLSRFTMASVWSIARTLQRLLPGSQATYKAGVVTLLATVLAWTALLWSGWLLLFLPHAGSVVASPGGTPADFWSRVYFVGYSLVTLGVGDYAPSGAAFQVLTVVAALSGFFMLTLSVTYLIPVVSAVVQARQLAGQIFLLGDTPASVALAALANGATFSQYVQSLISPLMMLTERHYAYPVLRYFPSSGRGESVAVALAVLDEAITMLLLGLKDEEATGLDHYSLDLARKAIGNHLDTRDLPGPVRSTPAAPSLAAFGENGIGTVADSLFRSRLAGVSKRRKALLALLVEEGRDWQEVWG